MEINITHRRYRLLSLLTTLLTLVVISNAHASIIQYHGACQDGQDSSLSCANIGLVNGDAVNAEIVLSDASSDKLHLTAEDIVSWNLNFGSITASEVLTDNWDFQAWRNNQGQFLFLQLLGSLPHTGNGLFGVETFDIRMDSWFATPNGNCTINSFDSAACNFNESTHFIYYDQGPGQALGSVNRLAVISEPATLALFTMGLMLACRRKLR